MTIPIPAGFHFRTTVNSHGWYDLPPFRASEDRSHLSTILSLTANKHVAVTIRETGAVLTVSNDSKVRLTRTEQERIKNIVRSMLRMDEELTSFYSLCRKLPHLRWVPKRGAGRILRSPTVFEDVVKMLFTTNCSWALTRIQTTNLTTKLGRRTADGSYTFPTPAIIAQRSERWLRKELSCGYRAPYLLKLCRDIGKGTLDLEALRHSDLPTDELYRTLRTIKGIGHYAAGNILKLLGRYDYLGIDSWVRTRYSEIHRNGKPSSDAAIEKHYDQYGKWRGLVCLMEVTSDWHA
jgi:N-glycosylase/DNA lyase